MAVQLKPDTEALLEQEALRRGQDADTLVRELLQQVRDEALERLAAQMDRGIARGGTPFKREDLYADRIEHL